MSTMIDQHREADYAGYMEWLASLKNAASEDLGQLALSSVLLGLQLPSESRLRVALKPSTEIDNPPVLRSTTRPLGNASLHELTRPADTPHMALVYSQRDYDLAA